MVITGPELTEGRPEKTWCACNPSAGHGGAEIAGFLGLVAGQQPSILGEFQTS